MKKLFTLIGALLLWQSVAVAQNELHIWTGDTTKIVRLAVLDSVTVRDAEFYKIDLNNVNGLRFTGRVSDYWGSVYSFNVTLHRAKALLCISRIWTPSLWKMVILQLMVAIFLLVSWW